MNTQRRPAPLFLIALTFGCLCAAGCQKDAPAPHLTDQQIAATHHRESHVRKAHIINGQVVPDAAAPNAPAPQ